LNLEQPVGIEIPWESLSASALEGVIDDFILREGTDYGWHETSLEKKRQDIQRQLAAHKAKILYDAATESITLVVPQHKMGFHSQKL
jgi:uncharacterized protein YheU (UPF0270 family)